MIFLTDQDFIEYQVRAEVLAVLKISTTTLDTAELVAIETVTAEIKTHFDAAATFAATGSARNPLIVMYMIDIIIYHLHSNTPSRVVPKERKDRFDAATHWLEKVNMGRLSPTLPPLDTTITPDPIYRFDCHNTYSQRW